MDRSTPNYRKIWIGRENVEISSPSMVLQFIRIRLGGFFFKPFVD